MIASNEDEAHDLDNVTQAFTSRLSDLSWRLRVMGLENTAMPRLAGLAVLAGRAGMMAGRGDVPPGDDRDALIGRRSA